jgi:LytS/YehU family sensor histidine kinase
MNKFPLSIIALLIFSLSQAQVNDGLVAKYSFNNGGPIDEIGKNHAKAVSVSFSKDRFGNPASACYLHGYYGSYLNLGTSSVLKPKIGSVSLWFSLDNIVLGGKGALFNPIILTKNHAGDDFYEGYYIGYDIGPRRLTVTTTDTKDNQAMLRSADIISSQKWHHVVITFDSTNLTLYINGVLENNLKRNFVNKYLSTDSVMVGNSANLKNNRFFNGSIDDIQIYNRVLNSKEVAELYAAPDPKVKNTVLKWTLLAILSIGSFVLLVIFGFKRYYKKELDKKQAENMINARLNELETRAIRNQMNPHFIFNSLNTLQRFILEENLPSAQNYLSKFSKLLRKLLESSQSDRISLQEEMEIINGYVEIEKMRFDNSFDYEIRSEIDGPEFVYIPFMLVQPFVENAIWHGLMRKSGNRFLKIHFSNLDEQRILCTVDDNGVGREFSAGQKDPLKKKSLAIDFITQRLELLSKFSGVRGTVRIIDKKENGESKGTTVEIIIPKIN